MSTAPVPVPSAADEEQRRWLAPVSALAAIVLGRAVQIANGALDPVALAWVTFAFALVLGATVVPRPARFARADRWVLPIIALCGLAVNIAQLHTALPGSHLLLRTSSMLAFHWGLAALAVIGASLVRGGSRSAIRFHIGALVAVHFALGIWIIQHAPSPHIDVFVFQQNAVAALRTGIDPYGMTFRNIYPDTVFYGPGLSVDGRLQFGFPYPPLSLLASLPGQAFGGDHRYSQLVAMEVAACLMAFARPGIFGPIAAVLYLTTPRIFFVLEQSWTEPFVVLGLAAVVFAASRHSRMVPWLFGAFIAFKQYLILAVPASFLLMRRPLVAKDVLAFLTKAAVVVAAVTLPFFVWSPDGFWRSVVTLQLYQPFRHDALSYLAWWVARGHDQPSAAFAFAAAAFASAVALWRLPRTAGGFAAAVSLTFFAFFVFNKQAFCNYYFFVIGALCTTLAAWHAPKDAT